MSKVAHLFSPPPSDFRAKPAQAHFSFRSGQAAYLFRELADSTLQSFDRSISSLFGSLNLELQVTRILGLEVVSEPTWARRCPKEASPEKVTQPHTSRVISSTDGKA